MKLARSAPSRSLSGFAGSVNAAPAARASGRVAGEINVASRAAEGGATTAGAGAGASGIGTPTMVAVTFGASLVAALVAGRLCRAVAVGSDISVPVDGRWAAIGGDTTAT